MIKGGMNIRQFANAGRSKKKCPISRPCVADTGMEEDVTTAICRRWGDEAEKKE